MKKASSAVPLPNLTFTFLKIGALGFGGPFSLLAIMQKQVVERRQWLTPDEFTQSVGIGTVTPGPIFFATAIFIGYRLRGIPGAVLAGLALLLPSFIAVVVIAALYLQVEQNAWVIAISHGIAAGVVGLFLSIVLKTGRATAHDIRSAGFVVVAFVALVFFRMDPLLLIVAAGLAGAALCRPALRMQAAEK